MPDGRGSGISRERWTRSRAVFACRCTLFLCLVDRREHLAVGRGCQKVPFMGALGMNRELLP